MNNSTNQKKRGMVFLKWLLPLLLIVGLGWFIQQGSEKKNKVENHDKGDHKGYAKIEEENQNRNMAQDHGYLATDHFHDHAKIDEVKTAPQRTTAEMKTLFMEMFNKKEGVSYVLNDIVFDKKSHRITNNFNKSEVEGLAQALRAHKTGKIEVKVYTNDGKNSKASEKLSKTRAEVVKSMLTTLGVNKDQIHVKGMGRQDTAKAEAEKIEILVK